MKPLPQTAVDYCAREALAKENIAEIVRVLNDNVRVGSCALRDDNEDIVTFLVRLNGDLTTPLQNLAVIDYGKISLAGIDIRCQIIISRDGMLERLSADIVVGPPPNRYLLTSEQRANLEPGVGIGFIQFNPNFEQTEISLFFLKTTATYEQLSASELIVAPPCPGVPVRLYLPRYFG